MSKEFSYGICPYKIVKNKIQIMLVQSTGHTEWGFIKGKIESGESIEECAKRECLEETNIKFSIKHLEDYFYQVNKKKNIGIFLINVNNLDVSKIKLARKELQSYKYFNLVEDIDISKNSLNILNSIREKFNILWRNQPPKYI